MLNDLADEIEKREKAVMTEEKGLLAYLAVSSLGVKALVDALG